MNAARRSIASAAYALFALEQPISLVELAVAARELDFPLATTQTPTWFAAAAQDDYSLLETAPELLVLPAHLDSATTVDVTGIDLIHVYAPELADGQEATATPEPQPPAPSLGEAVAEMPRTSTQLGLLKELSNLDT